MQTKDNCTRVHVSNYAWVVSSEKIGAGFAVHKTENNFRFLPRGLYFPLATCIPVIFPMAVERESERASERERE
jgi:hypothetical protein